MSDDQMTLESQQIGVFTTYPASNLKFEVVCLALSTMEEGKMQSTDEHINFCLSS